ncbi:MAG: altronate dehydratase family protein [Acetobacter sp.]|nr:altronate dehydratase family protein [Bacteroides sp.]MCM1342038.1 altronate dehydratase family protein [Acetobacter sp.]MCM1434234.1 altronate dehydratase family protein [Clostridiales bacterium]
MNKLFLINELDNVAIALEPLQKGYTENGITVLNDIPFGHKVLLEDLKCGSNIIKYGNPIGHLICDAKKGSYIHEHNMKTNLNDKLEYTYEEFDCSKAEKSELYFDGYLRPDGRAGTRNEIWIISTVGCINNTVRQIEKLAQNMHMDEIDGVFAYTHPYGCSQMGEDQENTRKILASLINHSNAGAVLVVSLGCENTNVKELKKYLGNYDENRVKFLVTQDCADELEEAEKLLHELYNYARQFKREKLPCDKLIVGFKCGGSDAFSGITANALCGRITDMLTDNNSTAILTEVPEMFGAEHILMKRAENKATFEKIVGMINGYKDYFSSHNQVCYENPSPGNHDGGITTLEEKSLGCIQKGGNAAVTDVLDYGETAVKSGLNLLTGCGNDIVSTTNLTCSGANVIMFTTGRGTPLGAPVPTIKISSNSILAQKKSNWIDFNAGDIIINNDFDGYTDDLMKLLLAVASGEKTKNEINNYREIAIFKDGVTM